jgi:hypothetical protein
MEKARSLVLKQDEARFIVGVLLKLLNDKTYILKEECSDFDIDININIEKNYLKELSETLWKLAVCCDDFQVVRIFDATLDARDACRMLDGIARKRRAAIQ